MLGNHWWKLPALARHDNNRLHKLCHHRSFLIRNMVLLPKTNQENSGRAKRRKETPAHNMSCQSQRNPHTRINLGCKIHAPPGKTLSQTKYGHEQDDWPETTRKGNPIIIKPEAANHMAEQFSWVPLPCYSPPGLPFPIKCFALMVHVSPRTIHFQVLDKSPLLGPGRGPSSSNKLEIKDAAKHHTVHRTAPYNRVILSIMPVALRLRNFSIMSVYKPGIR